MPGGPRAREEEPMNLGARNATESSKQAFERIACGVLSLDPGARLVALKQAGQEPRWAGRASETSGRYVGRTNADLVSPLKLILAKEGVDSFAQGSTDAHRLMFVAPACACQIEIVARLPPDAHMSATTERSIHLTGAATRHTINTDFRLRNSRDVRGQCNDAEFVCRSRSRSRSGRYRKPEGPAPSGLTNRWSGEKKSASSPQPFALGSTYGNRASGSTDELGFGACWD
jgi:hypothetical protein